MLRRPSLGAARVTACLGLACATAWPLAAHAQTTAPGANANTGVGDTGIGGGVLPGLGAPRIGDLRPQLEQYLQPTVSLAQRPRYVITPAIDVQAGATDNAYSYSTRSKPDVFTTISPQLVASADSARLKANLNYSPQATIYASTPSQNQFSNYFTGDAHGIVVPDLFFIDARGAITQQSLTSGGFNQNYGTGQTFNRRDDVETTTISIHPYLEKRFGGYGTGRLGYEFDRTLQDQNGNSNNTLNNQAFGYPGYGYPGYGNTGNLSTSRENAAFSTGENLGRFNDQVTGQAVQYAGAGSYHGAYRNEAQNQLSVALDHTVALLGAVGYQQLRYSSNGFAGSGVNINEPTWAVGIRYAPTPDTSVTIEYGHHDGDTNLGLDGQVAITPRLRLIARYSTGITSDLEQQQSLLDNVSVTDTGAITDRATGAPTNFNTGFSGIQNGIYRLKRASATLFFLRPRDSFSLSLNHDDRTSLTGSPALLGGAVVPAGTSTTSTYASLGWQHDLAPDMSTNVTVQYGTTNYGNQVSRFGGNGDQTTLSASATLSKQFTETLSGRVSYTHNDQTGGQVLTTNGVSSGTYSSNIILVGLHKNF